MATNPTFRQLKFHANWKANSSKLAPYSDPTKTIETNHFSVPKPN